MINPHDYHILLAEDDDWLRETFSILLERKRFACTLARDGKELYELAKSEKLKQIENLVIVSDTDMPLMDGDRACKKLLEEFPEIYQKRIIIGMSDNPENEKHWKGIEVWQSFIYKGSEIANPSSKKNLAELVFNRMNTTQVNSGFYINPDGTYRKSVNQD